jgi:hypothetical protein
MRVVRWFSAMVMFGAAGAPLAAQVSPPDSVALVDATQSMMNAVTSGDSSVWAPYLAPYWFMVDEEGRHISRAEFLAELHPLPAGQHGSITVNNPRLIATGSVIVLSYDCDEVHDFYGQRLITKFHATDTWVRNGRGWRQIATQVTALPTLIPGMRVADKILRRYAGRYALTPDVELAVTVGDSGLLLGRPGQPANSLFALDDHIFIRHGVRGFWVFEPDSTGTITKLVNWRDNNAVVWSRQTP